MKLHTQNATRLARSLGYKNARAFLIDIDAIGDCSYTPLKTRCEIGHQAVFNIYNAVGEENTKNIILFGAGGIEAFKSKFIQIGNKLL